MAGRRTNLALLVLLAAALATGLTAFGFGTRPGRLVLVAHGAIGLAIVLLTPWKSVIARRGLGRGNPARDVAITLAVLVPVALLTGVLHSTLGYRSVWSVTALQLHIGAALLTLPVLVWHVASHRQRVRRTDLSRRNALRLGTLSAGALVSYAVVEQVTAVAGLPGGNRRFTGSFATSSGQPAAMPVTQWLTDDVPSVDPDRWRLRVGTPRGGRSWSYDELLTYSDAVRATLDCTGGWYAEQDWSGVLLSRLLPADAGGRSVEVVSLTGYRRRLPLADAHRVLVATRLAGKLLTPGHGFPARLVVPGRRGFWWVKWVASLEVSDNPWWLQPPFPLQ